MVEYDFGCRFHDLDYIEVGIYFTFLEFSIYLRASSQKLYKKNPSI
jgi:hypothetical protein